MIARGEPPSLAVKMLDLAGGIGNINPVFNATLDHADENGTIMPLLAEALPQLDSESWRVFPDGRMETTHRLRPNLTWHDGTAFTADDFVFGWRVYATPQLGQASSIPISAMSEVTAPDPRTVVIRWRQPFPDAAALLETFQALPRHILETPYQNGDWEAFANHLFWTQEYVGLGPFRLTSWEPGAAINAAAFDGYALGKPKIERMRITFTSDSNTAVANLLSGTAHIVIDFALQYEQGAILDREWSSKAERDRGAVLNSPVLYRNSVFQLRPEMAVTPALLDLRFRRALAHGMDKRGIIDALIGGKAIYADGLLSPLVDYYPSIERSLVKYPYDPRRAQQLLDEVGLAKGGDGFYVNPNGESFGFEIRFIASPTHDAENNIITAGYRQLGINAFGLVLPVSQLRDGHFMASFPGILTTGAAGGERDMSRYSTPQIRRAENRWQGTNSGGWANAEYDRLWDAYNTTLARPERIQQLARMEQLFTEDLPAIPHYYTLQVAARAPELAGPVMRTTREAVEVVHLHKWELRS